LGLRLIGAGSQNGNIKNCDGSASYKTANTDWGEIQKALEILPLPELFGRCCSVYHCPNSGQGQNGRD